MLVSSTERVQRGLTDSAAVVVGACFVFCDRDRAWAWSTKMRDATRDERRDAKIARCEIELRAPVQPGRAVGDEREEAREGKLAIQ